MREMSPILIQFIVSILIIVIYFAIARHELKARMRIALNEELKFHNERLYGKSDPLSDND